MRWYANGVMTATWFQLGESKMFQVNWLYLSRTIINPMIIAAPFLTIERSVAIDGYSSKFLSVNKFMNWAVQVHERGARRSFREDMPYEEFVIEAGEGIAALSILNQNEDLRDLMLVYQEEIKDGGWLSFQFDDSGNIAGRDAATFDRKMGVFE
jgi:hypothetical protein